MIGHVRLKFTGGVGGKGIEFGTGLRQVGEGLNHSYEFRHGVVWLGLDFQRIGQDQLKLNMTNIDRNDPDRIFSFAVQIDPNDQYHVILCEPQLPNVDGLVGELNSNNDFSKFVRSMRKAFCTLPGVAR